MTGDNRLGENGTSARGSVAMKVVQLTEVTAFPVDRHSWGQFVYSVAGVVELTVKGSRYAAPPDFGVWLPPETEHLAWAGDETTYLLLDIEQSHCDRLPHQASVLSVGPIAKAILLDLKKRGVREPGDADDARLMRVLIDQLSVGSPLESFLPLSNDRALKQVLEALLQDPGDGRSLGQWANHVHSTERTLARRCARDLGMSFVKWRQRLRLARAVPMLADGLSVQTVAHKLGYSTTSAFIAMFQDAIGATPNAFRGRLREHDEGR
ncbi:probable transcriptional regulator protein, AraC family (plasmid) [Rhizobium etli CIAT 652]|uniref:Probable transcriptional regulator protein, AraC family n=1 Tax=Rhizobium etli (strain CIAT 652) TaxID=491916 RepID=B3Q476_RHIE6|nr:probable transcriptional regulator protein, AraC family [Rhizobium etli CIAT 652]EGE60877.1 putative transcriptional regulator protein, AraC family [Rhizobium etli CNPAF512]